MSAPGTTVNQPRPWVDFLSQLVSALEAKLEICAQSELQVRSCQSPYELWGITTVNDSTGPGLPLPEVRLEPPPWSHDPTLDLPSSSDHRRRRRPG